MIPTYIKKLKPYEPPLIKEGNNRLFMNENLFGPAPKCFEAISKMEKMDFCRYSHGGDLFLTTKLADYENLSTDNICLNHGSSEVIKQIFSVVLKKNELALVPQPGWSYYTDAISLVGGKSKNYKLKEEEDFKYNTHYLKNLILTENPDVVVITSPNMPTGNKISQIDLIELLKMFEKCFFIIDEAYWGFDEKNVLIVDELVNTYKNVIITRTFSKFYGLASERIGWLITNMDLCRELKKAAPLFGISYSSQLIAAAVLESKEYYDNVRRLIYTEVCKFEEALNQIEGFKVYPSSANFILVKVPVGHTKSCVAYLESKGFLIRDCCKYGLDSFVRISIGTPSIDNEIIKEIKAYVKRKL